MSIHKLNRTITRDELKGDAYYFDESAELYFYTPDGVGGFWYETKAEMFEQHNGDDVVYHVDEILDF